MIDHKQNIGVHHVITMHNMPISVEENLRGELIRDIKHELIDGHVYAMAGANANHERLSNNLSRKLGHHLETSP